MSRYIITDDNFIRINESYGTIENLSDFKAEVYTSPTATEGIILYPRARLSFNQPIYVAREKGESGWPVLATIPFTCCDGGGGSGSGGDLSIDISNGNCGCDCDNVSSDTCTGGSLVINVPESGSSSGDCNCVANPSVVIPSSACGGELKLQVPIVINMPQHFTIPCGCGGGSSTGTGTGTNTNNNNNSSGTGTDSGTSTNGSDFNFVSDDGDVYDFEKLTDEYFGSKTNDTYTNPSSTNNDDSFDFMSEADKYFANK